MKKKYINPLINIENLSIDDVIAASTFGEDSPGSLEFDPANPNASIFDLWK